MDFHFCMAGFLREQIGVPNGAASWLDSGLVLTLSMHLQEV
jgi:hypothetical protein